MNWLKGAVSHVAGTAEPIYGPSAIQTVTQRSGSTTHTELKRDDFKWAKLHTTSVETQTFYLFSKEGHIAVVQVIYSNVANLNITCQFNCKIFYPDGRPSLWSSDPLSKQRFSDDMTAFYTEDRRCSVTLSEAGDSYTIRSNTNQQSIVDLKVHRRAPAWAAGKDGISNFGKNPAEPWGQMKHQFWVRAEGEGTIVTKDGPIDFGGSRVLFSHALQGMKPHHAAARWNFVDFQTPTFSAIMMEFTTPKSYGETTVNVGGVVKDGEIVYAGTTNTAKHTEIENDSENGWPAPTSAEYKWSGTTTDGKPFEAELAGSLGKKLDRVDVMAEVPGFIKSFVGHAVGTKPYIYQYSPQQKLKLKITIDGQTTEEEGTLFTEATFISV